MLRRSLLCISLLFALASPACPQEKAIFQFEKGDRVAWVGSSSTNIGVWPKTMEFLLRTRHPELQLSFKKFSTGGGTFATGVLNLDNAGTLDDFFISGGDSLAMAPLLERVRDLFDMEISIAAFLEEPTIAGLARLVESHRLSAP